MKTAIRHLDRILRGDATTIPALRSGALDIPVGRLSLLLAILAALYGCCMGWYRLFNHENATAFKQMLSSMGKVPALFFFTLVVTFPSLYVFNALVGSRLTFATLVRLMIAAMGVLLAVLASFGPIVAFFSVTTTSHAFILLLNVAFCAVAGLLGMAFLLQTLHRISVATIEDEFAKRRAEVRPSEVPSVDAAVPVVAPTVEPISPDAQSLSAPPEQGFGEAGGPRKLRVPAHMQDASQVTPPPLPLYPAMPAKPLPQPPAEPPSALDRLQGQVFGHHVKTVFRCWVILFALVGTQMSWVLRPFIGMPGKDFHIFEPRGSNFFQAVWETLTQLMGR